MYLTDDDLIQTLSRCRDNLTFDPESGKSGLIYVKENIKQHGAWLDRDDNSLIRNAVHFQKIFEVAGFEVLHKSTQLGWPKDLFQLMQWVLRPIRK